MRISLRHIFLTSLLSNPWAATALVGNNPGEPLSLTEIICPDTQGRSSCDVELDVPSTCVYADGTSECPIVFFLHGSGGTNRWFSRTSGVHGAGFIGVYPQGEGGWNTGPKDTNTCDWDDYDCTADPDEGKFIASIITEIRNRGGNGNVYAIGNSNGAALAHRLAANAGDELPIKGIVAKVTQLLASPERSGPGDLNYNQPNAGPAVSILSVMGTADGLIPYEGGPSAVFGGDENFQLMSALKSMETWATHNGCDTSANISEHSSTKGTSATKYEYSGCPFGVVVEHYAIHDGGHDAGGTDIDGVSVDYDLAFEFINRVESGDGGGGGGEPPSSPVASPVASPTTSDSCVNDPSWHGKFNVDHNCDYVADSPGIRCSWESSDGISAYDACPVACDVNCLTDDSISFPVASPVASPVTSPTTSDSCVNDPSWHGKFNVDHNCDYVADNPGIRCSWESSDGISAYDACPVACDVNCLTDDSISFPVASPVASPVTSPTSECEDDATWAGKFNVAHDCNYVALDPAVRCAWVSSEGVTANDACPIACSSGCASRKLRKRYLRSRM